MNLDILDLFDLLLGTSLFATQLCPNFNLSYGAIHSNSLHALCVVRFGPPNLVFTPSFTPNSAYKHSHKRTMWVKVLALLASAINSSSQFTENGSYSPSKYITD